MTIRTKLIRFLLVGSINTAVDILSYWCLLSIGTPLIISIVISTTLGMGCSYALNRRWTFQATHHAVVPFVVITLIGLWVLQPLIITALSHLFWLTTQAELTMAKLMATGASLVWNFMWYQVVLGRPGPLSNKKTP